MKEKPIGSLAGIPIILAVGAAFAGMAWYLLSAISAASITPAGFIAALAVVVVGIFSSPACTPWSPIRPRC